MKSFYILLALAVGVFVPLQAGVNVRLKLALGNDPMSAAFVSFAVGTVVLGAWVFSWGSGLGGLVGAVDRGPWWMWTGGVMGAFFVASTIVLAANLGAASMLVWVIASQLMAGVLMDHYGLVGYAVREVSPLRLVGVGFLVAGAVLVQKF
ncbi:MAG: DMT family transporter [Proteobacteria bacterium]|nr:DMT family transporter [Pseudomonadota bacterium]MBU1611333.1 DMT family transporter [Pseudomonadota bacterium]